MMPIAIAMAMARAAAGKALDRRREPLAGA
jgi:hypothetical protein